MHNRTITLPPTTTSSLYSTHDEHYAAQNANNAARHAAPSPHEDDGDYASIQEMNVRSASKATNMEAYADFEVTV